MSASIHSKAGRNANAWALGASCYWSANLLGTMRLLLFLMFSLLCVHQANADSPISVSGRTLRMTIESAETPFASSGSYRILPSGVDNSYAIVPTSGATSVASGAYSYAKTGAATAQLGLSEVGFGGVTISLTFTNGSSGSYVVTTASFPGATQQGIFLLYSGKAPSEIYGYSVTVTVSSGAAPFASGGSYRFLPANTGSAYAIQGISGFPDSVGTYSYSKTTDSTGLILFTDSLVGSGLSSQLSFDTETTGTVLLKQDGSGGYQTATFEMVIPGPPTITIAKSNLKVIVSWPDFAAHYRLESTTELVAIPPWVNANPSLETNSGRVLATFPINAAQRYYRLIKP